MRDLATLGPDEVAQLIGASEWWVREQARNRKVPHLRFGRDQIKFRRTDVVALMDLAAIAPVSLTRAEPEGVDAEKAGTAGLRAEATAAYRLAKAAGRPEQAARQAARKLLPGFMPERTAV
ncbi:helix-turn-helix domain-containing protein [Nakamurella multipartita]|nr:helix-turn-helix domain-containing protein [Nakamurella multipartita]